PLGQSARPGTAGAARLSRAVARALVFRDWTACGISEFILMTVARNHGQQAPIALNAGVGLAMIAFGITRSRAEVMPRDLPCPRFASISSPLALIPQALALTHRCSRSAGLQ